MVPNTPGLSGPGIRANEMPRPSLRARLNDLRKTKVSTRLGAGAGVRPKNSGWQLIELAVVLVGHL